MGPEGVFKGEFLASPAANKDLCRGAFWRDLGPKKGRMRRRSIDFGGFYETLGRRDARPYTVDVRQEGVLGGFLGLGLGVFMYARIKVLRKRRPNSA